MRGRGDLRRQLDVLAVAERGELLGGPRPEVNDVVAVEPALHALDVGIALHLPAVRAIRFQCRPIRTRRRLPQQARRNLHPRRQRLIGAMRFPPRGAAILVDRFLVDDLAAVPRPVAGVVGTGVVDRIRHVPRVSKPLAHFRVERFRALPLGETAPLRLPRRVDVAGLVSVQMVAPVLGALGGARSRVHHPVDEVPHLAAKPRRPAAAQHPLSVRGRTGVVGVGQALAIAPHQLLAELSEVAGFGHGPPRDQRLDRLRTDGRGYQDRIDPHLDERGRAARVRGDAREERPHRLGPLAHACRETATHPRPAEGNADQRSTG